MLPAPVKTPECLPPPPPPETPASKLKAAQQNLALPKLELFRTSVRNTTPEKNFLKSLISTSAKPIDGELLLEMQRYTERFADFPDTAEVLHLQGVVHARIEQYPAAAIDWLMLKAGYPDSPFSREANKRLQGLMGDELKKYAAQIKDWSTAIAQSGGTREQRQAALLKLLGNNSEKDFAAPIAAACASFLAGNQSWLREDEIEHAWARQVALLDPQLAVYHFEKVLALYPDSPLRADSLLSLGHVQRSQLFAYGQAATTYNKLIQQFPNAPETMQGYYALAEMYDKDMRDYPNALKTFDAIVQRYQTGRVVLDSLRAMANIQQNRVNRPADAVGTLLRLADTFKGADGMEALLAAARIANFTLRDWKLAIQINERIIALYGGSDEAIKAEYNTADLTENKLNDKAAALKAYQSFVDKHPGHALAREASRRIEALARELNPQSTPTK